MSLIKCPECERQVSDRAASCPHCGMPLTAQPSAAVVTARLQTPPPRNKARSGASSADEQNTARDVAAPSNDTRPLPSKPFPFSFIGYVVTGLWLFGFILAGNVPLIILGLLALTVLLLRSNPQQLRQRLPGFRSPSRLAVAGSWAGLVIGGLVLTFGAAALMPPSSKPTASPSTTATSASPVSAAAPTAETAPTLTPTVAAVQSPTVIPTPNATATPDTPALLARLDEDWQKGNWPAALGVLDALQAADPEAADFTDKRYVAEYSWGKSLLDQGDKPGAATHFMLASQIDPSRTEGETQLLALTPTPAPVPPTPRPSPVPASPTPVRQTPMSGETGRITNGSTTIYVASTEKALDDLTDAIIKKDQYGVLQLLLADQVYSVTDGTKVLALDRGGFLASKIKVRIMEGPQTARVGWLPYEWVTK